MEAVAPVLTPDGWRRIPRATRETLQSAGLVIQGPAAQRVRCPVCAHAHYERVIARPDREGNLQYFINCPKEMRVQIKDADRQTWRVNVEAVATAVSASLCLVGVVRPMGSDRVYHCGHYLRNDIRMDVYLARGLCRKDGRQIATSVPRSIVRPLVLAPKELPAGKLWAEMEPSLVLMSTAAWLENGQLVVDSRLVEQAFLRASRGDYSTANVFRSRGDFWDVAFDGSEIIHVARSVGMAYIARLLAQPHESIPAVTLLAARAGIDPRVPTGSTGKMLDERMKTDLRRAYADLMAQREEAEKNNDFGTLDALEKEMDQLTVELSQRLGLYGHAREGSDVDRVRKSVSMAVSRGITDLGKKLPKIETHLTAAISSGLFFKYAPDREIDWLL